MHIHLHTHSEYSLWDGLAKVSDLVKQAKKLEQPALAITDHGNLSAFPEFYKEAKAEGIVPIIGQEMYVIDDVSIRPKKDETNKDGTRKRGYYHLTVLAKNNKGYQTLVKMTSLANTQDNFFYKGRIDFKTLESLKEEFKNLIVLTGCEGGHIANALGRGLNKKARRYIEFYRMLFPNLFVEIMKHPGNEVRNAQQDSLNAKLQLLADQYDLPTIITNDIHYVYKEQQDAHRILITSANKGVDKNPDVDLFGGSGYHLKSEDEMRKMFSRDVWNKHQAAMDRVWGMVENFHVPLLDDKKWYIPKFPRKDADEISSADLIRRLCIKRLKKLGKNNSVYRERLKQEMEVVHRANFEEEFLIVRDIIRGANRAGILVGPGRGSMAGVLVAYLLGITGVDPIKYRLLFERAINPARPSLPDFDVDYQASRREEVVQYVTNKYGGANVLQVCTFNAMAPKGAVRAVLRAENVPYPLMVEATKTLPDTVEIIGERKKAELKDILEDQEFLDKEAKVLKGLITANPRIKDWAINLQGTIQSFGTHAAGVLISDGKQDLRRYIPTMWLAGAKRIVTQYDMGGCKQFGFVKFDILGLNTLDTIADAISEIGQDPFAKMEDLEDQETWDMMNSGNLTTIFQMQGYSCRACVKTMGIKSFEDLVAINALSRPGAIKFLDAYHQQRDHPAKVKYMHPKLKPILEMSNGVLLYQEQTMQIALDIAGWDHYITDDLKEAIKYKKSDVFRKLHPKFLSGCQENGVSKKTANALWDLIRDASGYQFNRAHAVSYAILGFQTAFLKRHYPAAWFAAYLRNTDTKSPDAKGKLSEIMQEARKVGVVFLPPDINLSGVSFKTEGRKKIRFGLSEVKGVGTVSASEIVKQRGTTPFMELEDLGTRVAKRGLNTRAYGALADIGALESLGVPSGTGKVERELQYLGVVIDFHVRKRHRRRIEKFLNAASNREALESTDDDDVVVGGILTNVHKHVTKKGELMARLRIDYYTGSWDCVLFPRQLEEYNGIVQVGATVLVQGRNQHQWNSIAVEDLVRLDEKVEETKAV